MLCDGDYLIMISDGVADSLPFYDKEKQLVRIISETKEENRSVWLSIYLRSAVIITESAIKTI